MVPSWVITQGLSGEISGWEGRSRWDRGSHRRPENGAEILGHILWPEALASSCGPLSWVVRLSTPMPEAVAVTDGTWTPKSHRCEFKSWLCCHELRDVENFTLPLSTSHRPSIPTVPCGEVICVYHFLCLMKSPWRVETVSCMSAFPSSQHRPAQGVSPFFP